MPIYSWRSIYSWISTEVQLETLKIYIMSLPCSESSRLPVILRTKPKSLIHWNSAGPLNLAFAYISSPIPHQVVLSLAQKSLASGPLQLLPSLCEVFLPSDLRLHHSSVSFRSLLRCHFLRETIPDSFLSPLTTSFYPFTLLLSLSLFFDLEHLSHHMDVCSIFACFVAYYVSIPQERNVGGCPVDCVDCDARA